MTKASLPRHADRGANDASMYLILHPNTSTHEVTLLAARMLHPSASSPIVPYRSNSPLSRLLGLASHLRIERRNL